MSAGQRIYYVSPDLNKPTGGVRVIYRHVEILNRNGFDASVLHARPGFRATWFENSAPVAYLPNVLVARDRDIVVFPEIMAGDVLTRFSGARKVILNQGFFLTFAEETFDPTCMESPYRHSDLCAVLVNSRAGKEYLGHVFEKLPLHHVRVSIDPTLF